MVSRETQCSIKVITGLGLAVAALLLYHRFIANNFWWLKNYVLVGRVTKIKHYPVASIKGLNTEAVNCTRNGLKLSGIVNKEFVITKVSGKDFATSTVTPTIKEYFCDEMRCLAATSDGRTLYLTAQDNQKFELDFRAPPRGKVNQIMRAKDILVAMDMGDEVANWLSDVLGESVRLHQCINTVFSSYPGRQHMGNCVVFAEESVAFVKKKLGLTDIKTSSFQPNIVISGCDPMDERWWSHIRIGESVYMQIKGPDVRLVSTDPIDHHNWVRTFEPIEPIPNVVMISGFIYNTTLGVNAEVVSQGEIRIGDPVFAARYYKEPSDECPWPVFLTRSYWGL